MGYVEISSQGTIGIASGIGERKSHGRASQPNFETWGWIDVAEVIVVLNNFPQCHISVGKILGEYLGKTPKKYHWDDN